MDSNQTMKEGTILLATQRRAQARSNLPKLRRAPRQSVRRLPWLCLALSVGLPRPLAPRHQRRPHLHVASPMPSAPLPQSALVGYRRTHGLGVRWTASSGGFASSRRTITTTPPQPTYQWRSPASRDYPGPSTRSLRFPRRPAATPVAFTGWPPNGSTTTGLSWLVFVGRLYGKGFLAG